MKKIDLTGKRFGKWTVLERSIGKKGSYWLCQCDCGKIKDVFAGHFVSGKSKSCTCTRHVAQHPAHGIWSGIKTRCYLKSSPNYKNYGARGISMCDEWITNSQAFVDWAMSTGYRKGLSIERKDNEKGYTPDNCIWIPRGDQNLNKRNTIWVIWKGVKVSLAKLLNEKGLNNITVKKRIIRGWSLEDALTKPTGKYERKGE